MDGFSRMRPQILHMFVTPEKLTLIERNFRQAKDVNNVLKWVGRGLSVTDAIDKLKAEHANRRKMALRHHENRELQEMIDSMEVIPEEDLPF